LQTSSSGATAVDAPVSVGATAQSPVQSPTPTPTQTQAPFKVPAPVSPQNTAATDPTAQTIFTSKPPQLNQSQAIPAGLSRENPGGTPPNMTVSAPASSLTQANTTIPSPPPASVRPPLPSRPSSPLDQISLNKQDQKPAVVSSSQPAQATQPQAINVPTSPAKQLAVSSPPPTVQAQPSPASAQIEGVADSPVAASEKPPAVGGFFAKIKAKLPLPALIGGGVLLIVLIGALIFSLLRPKSTAEPTRNTTSQSANTTNNGSTSSTGSTGQVTTLTYWGLWEDSQILKEVIADFESKNSGIKIDYRKQSHRDYRERLQQAIASGSGPDLFRYHVAWVPMLSQDLAAMPSSVMSLAEYKQIFYPTAYNNLQANGQIVGIPLMYDGLALFYNKEMLRTANLDVPKTWAELRTAANKLTVPASLAERSSGNITRAGLAIGNAGNVDHFSDILALLIVQNGGNPGDASSQYVKDAVTFYTNFVKQDKVWSERLANSTTAFARGDVAMILAPSWRIHDIKNMNPNLDFAVTRLPQLDLDNPVAWATFWAEGVSDKSKNKEAAWAFLKHMSSQEVLRKFYNDASQFRAFGEIYPRTDMASELQNSDLVGAYVADAPFAKSWYMSSFTHDNGLNDQVIKYYEDAITAALSGSNMDKPLETAAAGVKSVLSKYSFQ